MPHRTPPRLVVALLALLVLVAGTSAAASPPDIPPTRTSEHFRFFAHGDVVASVDKIAVDAEERFQALCRDLAACDALDRPIDVWVAEDAERFASTFPGPSPMTEWAAGVAFIADRRVVLRAFGTALFTLRETFDHELSHILLHVVAGDRHVPRWFSEGMAIWQSGENTLQRLQTAHLAAVTGSQLPLEELDRRFPSSGGKIELAYAQSALFLRWLMQRHGHQAVLALPHDVGAGKDFAQAFQDRLHESPLDAHDAWVDSFDAGSSLFVLLGNETVLWSLLTILFIVVAAAKMRERKRQIHAMGETELAEDAFTELEAHREAGQPPTLH